jgi:hypothetical protein
MPACCTPAARPGCSTRCMRPRRWGSFCASSPLGMPTNARASGGARASGAAAGRHRAARFRGHRFAVAPGQWAGQAGRLVRARQNRQPRAAAARPVPAITTPSTATAAPDIAEARLRSGRAGSGRGDAGQVKAAIGAGREPSWRAAIRRTSRTVNVRPRCTTRARYRDADALCAIELRRGLAARSRMAQGLAGVIGQRRRKTRHRRPLDGWHRCPGYTSSSSTGGRSPGAYHAREPL